MTHFPSSAPGLNSWKEKKVWHTSFGFEESVLVTDLTKAITQEFQCTATAGKAVGQVASTEEFASYDFLNAQTQVPDIPGPKVEKKATCFQRVTDSKESINDPVAAESSPWRPASLPFTFFDNHYKFTGRWFRQIIPLVIRHTLSFGTNVFPKAPRLVCALGALGLLPQAAPQHFQRAVEVALGVSLNAQSQAPDIPGVSSHTVFLRHNRSYPRSWIYARCAHIRQSFWPPSTPKLKLPTIRLKF